MFGTDAAALVMIDALWTVVLQVLAAGLSLLVAVLLLYVAVTIASTAYFNALYRHILKLDEHYKGKLPNGL